MKRFQWQTMLGLVLWLGVGPAALAQQRDPHIGYIYPAGGQQGTTFQVKIGGQFLDGVRNVFIAGDGLQATVLEHTKPLTNKQANDLRAKLRELQKGKGWKDPATLKTIDEIRNKLAAYVRKPSSATIAETVTVQVMVAADARPGTQELRLGTGTGLSNPLTFQIDQLPEFREAAPNFASDLSKFKKPSRFDRPAGTGAGPETSITLPCVVNGQIMPGDIDRFRFRAAKGQPLVIAASARELIPYLADAVPGWFQATLTLYDAQGHEVAYDDDFRFHPDPVLFYKIPGDGEYVLEIKDALYRGREDFVYRIAVGELPFVTGIFPLGGKIGTQPTVGVWGWNLPVAKLALDPKKAAADGYPVCVPSKGQQSNRLQFPMDSLPELLEKESNNSPGNAQAVTLPVIVNGHIDPPGDWDVFRFAGRVGDKIVAEVSARRLDSPLDSVLKLTDAAGRQLAFNDDHEDKGTGLRTHHADSLLTATLPATGTYFVHLGDAQQKGAWSYGYRLRVSPPQPDFELRIVPSSISVRGGATVPLTVHALRRDGFTGEIALALKDAPAGFILSGDRVPANQDQVKITLSAPPRPTEKPVSLHVTGYATIAGREITHTAVPAEDMTQAFEYRHLVPSQELQVAVSGRYMARNGPLRILSPTPIQIPAGGTARVRVGVPSTSFLGPLHLELHQAPEGITIKEVVSTKQDTEIILQSNAKTTKPGLEGNLIVTVFADRTSRSSKAAKGKPQRFEVATLPAIPFEIVKQVAKR